MRIILKYFENAYTCQYVLYVMPIASLEELIRVEWKNISSFKS